MEGDREAEEIRLVERSDWEQVELPKRPCLARRFEKGRGGGDGEVVDEGVW